MKDSIRNIGFESYLRERELLDVSEKSLFDFLYLTGTRISEALAVKRTDFDWDKKKVNILTLKNPTDPYRSVTFFPQSNESMIAFLKNRAIATETSFVWEFPRRKRPQTHVWEVCKKTFGCTTHSFRHTNATLFCRAIRPNLNELMARYGWKDPKPALIYIKYAFDESLDEKINEYYQKEAKIEKEVNEGG